MKNQGVIFDQHLTMDKQASSIVKFCHIQIFNIGRIRSFLTNETYKTMVNVVLTARPDYGNCLLNGVAKHNFERIQPVQNHAARLVTRISEESISHLHVSWQISIFLCNFVRSSKYWHMSINRSIILTSFLVNITHSDSKNPDKDIQQTPA